MVRITQISDPHILGDKQAKFRGINPWDNFTKVLKNINQDEADLMVITGDLAEDRSKEAYQHIATEIKKPIAWVPGNHDNPELAATILGKSQKHIIFDNWQILLLNSHYPDHESGKLSDNELGFLEQSLKQHPDKYTLIFVHHQVVPVACSWLDEIMLENAAAMLAITQQYKNVKIIVFGHIHQEFYKKQENITFVGTPAISVQFVPQSQTTTIDKLKPGYRWFELNDDGKFTTEVTRF